MRILAKDVNFLPPITTGLNVIIDEICFNSSEVKLRCCIFLFK
jgi:hypothetical protein